MQDPLALQYARFMRPFPTRRLAETLYHVQQEAGSIDRALIRILIDPPRDAEKWTAELYALDTALASLQARCRDARPVLVQMVDTADSDFQRSLDALVALWRGLPDEAHEPAAQDLAA